jgi:bifunctional non-homologous end joining protein LigD
VALEEYKRKRDFSKSPEPAGTRPRQSPTGRQPRFFCVQKHLASHLHYDFRLEHNGVLLSWAVPKGPSIDPTVKRLAMKVEDHPLEYGEFEGVIPSGYGAGIVMLWDRGTWTPEVDDVEAALKKGDLKITLEGYKLKGSWVLVRTKGARWASGGADRSWLLIKHRDQWAGPVDITEFAPLSVKSEGDFADILAQDTPEIWVSHRPAQSGEAGALFEKIISRALQMRSDRSDRSGRSGRSKTSPLDVRRAGSAPFDSRSGRPEQGRGTKRTPQTGRAKPVKRKTAARKTR